MSGLWVLLFILSVCANCKQVAYFDGHADEKLDASLVTHSRSPLISRLWRIDVSDAGVPGNLDRVSGHVETRLMRSNPGLQAARQAASLVSQEVDAQGVARSIAQSELSGAESGPGDMDLLEASGPVWNSSNTSNTSAHNTSYNTTTFSGNNATPGGIATNATNGVMSGDSGDRKSNSSLSSRSWDDGSVNDRRSKIHESRRAKGKKNNQIISHSWNITVKKKTVDAWNTTKRLRNATNASSDAPDNVGAAGDS